MNLSYYNTKFQSLIDEARKDGFKLSDNGFVKTEDEKFPVMEVFLVNNTTYEDSGRFNVYKRTVKISQEDYDKIVFIMNFTIQMWKAHYTLRQQLESLMHV